MVSVRSATSRRNSASKSVTGSAGVRSTGSPNKRIGLILTSIPPALDPGIGARSGDSPVYGLHPTNRELPRSRATRARASPGVGHSGIGWLQPAVHPVEDRLGPLNTQGEVGAERGVRDAWEAEHLGDLPGQLQLVVEHVALGGRAPQVILVLQDEQRR